METLPRSEEDLLLPRHSGPRLTGSESRIFLDVDLTLFLGFGPEKEVANLFHGAFWKSLRVVLACSFPSRSRPKSTGLKSPVDRFVRVPYGVHFSPVREVETRCRLLEDSSPAIRPQL